MKFDALPKSPLVDLTHIIFQCRPKAKYWPRVFLYYVKLAFFEPFRWLEKIFLGRKLAALQLREDPIFILGYYRSGTTHLQEVLLQDRRYGYMNFFQCLFTRGFLFSEWLLKWPLQLYGIAAGVKHPAHRIPFRFTMPGEEDVAMVSSGFRLASNWGQLFPRKFREFFDKTVFFETATSAERALFEAETVRMVKRLAWANGNKPLILKSPPQTARIAMLARLFPRAKFIYIKRNPYFVFKSNQKLWQSFHGQALEDFTPAEANAHIMWSYDKSLQYYERDKSSVPENRRMEISFEEFQAQPLEVLARIYRHLEMGEFSDVKPVFAEYLRTRHGKNIDRYEFGEEERAMVSAIWSKWFDELGYSKKLEPKAEVCR